MEMNEEIEASILAGASGARLLAEACEASLESKPSLRLEVVRDLAWDLERHLAGLAGYGATPDPLAAEAAQKCADLATLAACNASELGSPQGAAEPIRLAAEAADALSRSVEENNLPDGGESGRRDLVRRDARSASWKASLAVRQFEESSGGRGDLRKD